MEKTVKLERKRVTISGQPPYEVVTCYRPTAHINRFKSRSAKRLSQKPSCTVVPEPVNSDVPNPPSSGAETLRTSGDLELSSPTFTIPPAATVTLGPSAVSTAGVTGLQSTAMSNSDSDEDVFGLNSASVPDPQYRVAVKREYQHCGFDDAANPSIIPKVKFEPADQLKAEPSVALNVPQIYRQRVKDEPHFNICSQFDKYRYKSAKNSLHLHSQFSQRPDSHAKAECTPQAVSYSGSQLSAVLPAPRPVVEKIDHSPCFDLETRLLAVDNLAAENHLAAQLLRIEMQLAADLLKIDFGTKVSHVYNPVDYAYKPHMEYYRKFCLSSAQVLMIGINPGPNGMSQTGVPFGEVKAVSQWMQICEKVGSPAKQHVKKPILGFDCRISEPSGTRIWNLIRSRFPSAEEFFKRCFVHNYCPLALMEPSGKNFTPAQLPAAPRRKVTELCDQALVSSITLFSNCHTLIGVGRFAEDRIKEVCRLASLPHKQSYLLHPSPLNRKSHKNWTPTASRLLEETGILPPSAENPDDLASSTVHADVDLVKQELFLSD